MHNIKVIRNDIETFKKALNKRFLDIDVDKILSLDESNREYIQQRELLEKEKKDISKSKDQSLFEKSKKISSEIDNINKLQTNVKNELETILSSIPNIPHFDVPTGKDENSNIEIYKSGTIHNFTCKPK